MLCQQIQVGSGANFVYLIAAAEGGEGILVDPAYDLETLMTEVNKHRVDVKYIVLTHHHGDHVNAAAAARTKTGAKVVAHPGTGRMLGGGLALDAELADGQVLELGPAGRVEVLHTPGHAPGSVCLLVGDRWLVTGDTLFIGDCGRTDLSGGDPHQLFASLQRLKTLPDHLEVMPGHNYGRRPTNTLGDEKRTNPTLRAATVEEFFAIP